jgi:hypothetical protein
MRRVLLLVGTIILVVLVQIALPSSSQATTQVCCVWIEVMAYYSDATHTTQVGTCVTDGCALKHTCTGTITAYQVIVSKNCCRWCQ